MAPEFIHLKADILDDQPERYINVDAISDVVVDGEDIRVFWGGDSILLDCAADSEQGKAILRYLARNSGNW